jgi:ribosomal protein L11 methyltransferase
LLCCIPQEEDDLSAALALLNPQGIQTTGGASHVELHAWFGSPEEAEACALGFAQYSPVLSEEADRNWNAGWQSSWQPMLVGRQWFLAPPSHREPAPDGRIRLDLHEGNAFGNGDHPATHLCLEAMEDHLPTGARFLDVGCGSGLLCIAALAAGAGFAAGCDIDAQAVAEARRRCPQARFWTGEVTVAAAQSFDVIVANLPAAAIIHQLGEFERVLSRSGTVICSGLLNDQLADLIAAANGWAASGPRSKGGWFSVVLAVAGKARKTLS